MRNIPPAVRSILDEDDLAEIESAKIAIGGETERDALELAVAWHANVRKLDADRELSTADRTAWNEHDFAGALFLRDHLESALSRLRPELRDKVERYVLGADDGFRSITVDDPGRRTAKIAGIDQAGRSWWWFRVPDSGPIDQDLSRYE